MSILSEIDFNIVCRTCLSYANDMKSLNETSSIVAHISFAEILTSFTSLKYFGNDGFPAQICPNCIQELGTSYKFQLKCLDSDDTLRKDVEKNAKTSETESKFRTSDVKIEMETDMDPMNDRCFDSIKQIYVPGQPLNTPLTFAELQNDLSQELDLIKNETSLGVKTEMEDNIETKSPVNQIKILETLNESLISETYNSSIIDNNTNTKLRDSKTKMDKLSATIKKSSTPNTNPRNQSNNLADLVTRRKPYSCTAGNKCFSNKTNLTAHMKNHPVQKLYTCTFCTSSFTKKKQLIVHNRQMHSGEKPYSCTVCNRCFSEESYLARHLQTHSENKGFYCLVCTSSFTQKSDLVAHMRTHAQNPYMCTICNASFRNKSYLMNHMRTHSEEKLHSCIVCKSSFKLKQHLTSHMPTHNKEKVYSCTECNSLFRNKSNLFRHMHTHSEEKPYSCTVCSCSFIQKQHLLRHIGMHLRENPDS